MRRKLGYRVVIFRKVVFPALLVLSLLLTTDTWQYFNPSMPQFSDLKELEPGRGYFIQMTQNDTWTNG